MAGATKKPFRITCSTVLCFVPLRPLSFLWRLFLEEICCGVSDKIQKWWQFADGLEYTRTAMVLSLCSLPINVFLNWLLIYGNWGFPRLELVGAGWATLITRTLIFLALLFVVLRHRTFKDYVALRKTEWVLRKKTWRELLGIGVPSSFQIGMEAGAFAVTGIIIGTIGAVAQAAHQIALSLASFTFMVSMGLSQAGSIRTSNAFGRNDWGKISVIGKSTLLSALLYGLFCACLFIVFRHQLPQAFTKNNEVQALAALLLLMAGIFQISDSTQAIGAGLLRGIKDVKMPTYLIGIAYWVVGIPSGYLFAHGFGLGATGMWLGLILGLTFASLFLQARFFAMAKRNMARLRRAVSSTA
jgi:multidrug resistance protein, MATE family